MAVEDIRGALEECAGHLTFVGEQYTGPVGEKLEEGVGHLTAASTALQVAFEELARADEVFTGLQNPSMEIRSRIMRAAQIAGQVATGSNNTLIANILPTDSSAMASYVKSLTDAIFTTANNTMIFGNRVRPMAEDVAKSDEAWRIEEERVNDHGTLILQRSSEVREYLQGL